VVAAQVAALAAQAVMAMAVTVAALAVPAAMAMAVQMAELVAPAAVTLAVPAAVSATARSSWIRQKFDPARREEA
jgi:hypothetical protein